MSKRKNKPTTPSEFDIFPNEIMIEILSHLPKPIQQYLRGLSRKHQLLIMVLLKTLPTFKSLYTIPISIPLTSILSRKNHLIGCDITDFYKINITDNQLTKINKPIFVPGDRIQSALWKLKQITIKSDSTSSKYNCSRWIGYKLNMVFGSCKIIQISHSIQIKAIPNTTRPFDLTRYKDYESHMYYADIDTKENVTYVILRDTSFVTIFSLIGWYIDEFKLKQGHSAQYIAIDHKNNIYISTYTFKKNLNRYHILIYNSKHKLIKQLNISGLADAICFDDDNNLIYLTSKAICCLSGI